MSVFDTRVKFYHRLPSSATTSPQSLSSPASPYVSPDDERDKPLTPIITPLAPLKQWILEQFSGYFHPINHKVFLASSYNDTKQQLEGVFHTSTHPSLLSTLVKIISYFSLIFPLLIAVALNYAKIPLVSHISLASPVAKLPPADSLSSPRQVKEGLTAEMALNFATSRRARIGGQAILNNQKVWISFKNHSTTGNRTLLQVNSIDVAHEHASPLIARVRLQIQDDQLTFQELHLNHQHPNLLSPSSPMNTKAFTNFDDAPEELQQALMPIARCLFYASVRWYIFMHESVESQQSLEQASHDSDSDTSSEVSYVPIIAKQDSSMLFAINSPQIPTSLPHALAFPSTPPLRVSKDAMISPRSRSSTRSNQHLSIIVRGNWATLLTQDGPERVVDDRYTILHDSFHLRIDPLPYKQAAFNTMQSPSMSTLTLKTSRRNSFTESPSVFRIEAQSALSLLAASPDT